MDRQHIIGMLGWRLGTPRWAGDTMWRRDGRCWRKGKKEDSPLKGSLTVGGVVGGAERWC